MVIAFSRVLKLHLYEVCALSISRHVGKPVIGIELLVLPAHSASAKTAATACTYLIG
jgi:hypothetical protein